MDAAEPIIEIRAPFADEYVAQEAADALNTWFRWIVLALDEKTPVAFESFGLDTADYAWTMGEDVDWEIGPHARTLGPEVRISIQTHDTHLHLSGLLRKLGALSVQCLHEGDL